MPPMPPPSESTDGESPDAGLPEPGPPDMAQLDAALERVMQEHPGRVAAWGRSEPGAWGFLSGQGVLAARQLLGRPLSAMERRVVWHQLWGLLERGRDRPPE